MPNEIVTPERVGGLMQPGVWFSRLNIAQAMGREKTTWVINQIERAVELGLVQKVPGYVGKQQCWCYGPPGQQPELSL